MVCLLFSCFQSKGTGLKLIAMNLSSHTTPAPLPQQKALHIVNSATAANILLQPDTVENLRPLMTAALSIRELSDVLAQPFAKVHYQLKKYVSLDLVTRSSSQLHKGRMRHRYCSSAQRFFVPFALTAAHDLKSFLRSHDEQWYESLLDAYVTCLQESNVNMAALGIGISLEAESNLYTFHISDEPDNLDKDMPCFPRLDSLWDTRFYLSVDDAAAMQEEIKAILAKYHQKRSGVRYVVRFAYAPWQG